MDGKRQVQSDGYKPSAAILLLPPLRPRGNWFSFQRVILFTRAPNKGNDELGRAGGLITMFVRVRQKKRGKAGQTLWHEVDTREGLRASCRWLRLLTCRAPRFSNSLPPSLPNTQCAGCRLIPALATNPPSLFVHTSTAVTKPCLLFRSSESGV